MFSSPRVEWASVEQTIATPASRARRTCSSRRSSRFGQPVHLDRAALLGEPGEDGLEVDRVRRPVVDQPPGRVAEAADVGRVQRGQHALGQLLARAALAGVDARLHPVELGQQVVGQVERAVAADVALGSAQEAERRELLVGGRDLLGLAAHAVGVEPGDGADADRVVADRQVLVAAVAGGSAHLEDRRPAVRPGRVAVQVAADVGHLDELGRLRTRRPRAARAGRTAGRARRRRLPRRPRRAAARARRPTRESRSRGRARSPGAPARRRSARPGRPRPSRPAPAGRRARRRPRSAAAPRTAPAPDGSPGTTTASRSDASRQRRGSPAAIPPSASAIDSTSGRLRCSNNGRGGCAPLALAPAPRAACAPSPARSPAPPAAVPASAASRSSASVRTPSTRPISSIRLTETPRNRPSPASSGETSRSSSCSSAISPVSTSSSSRRSIPGPIPRSSRARPCRTSSATGAGVERIRSAARR